MKFRPEHYLDASIEQINSATRLHKQRRYPAAIYLTGVAVECLLLAYRTRENPEFESRHDLISLLRESGMAGFVRMRDRKKLFIMMGDVWSRWKNNYRFASHSRLTSEFRRLKLDRGIRGEVLKTNSDILIRSAIEIINMG
jgi:hypothetical protein